MMERKRKVTSEANGKSKKIKPDSKKYLMKDSFLKEIADKYKLYTNEDRYYREVVTNIGPLELKWTGR